MECGSTGLGKRALKLKFLDTEDEWKETTTKPPEGALIIRMKSWDPVVWSIWVAIEPKDILPMLKIPFTKRALSFLLGSLKRVFRRRKAPAQEMSAEPPTGRGAGDGRAPHQLARRLDGPAASRATSTNALSAGDNWAGLGK